MEVHHHAHHSGNKNWKQYFWEFFMLFMAVFTGSLAELQLEHYIEHQREKKLMYSYHKDLKADISGLTRALKARAFRTPKFDSAMQLIHDHPEPHTDYLYYATAWIVRGGPGNFTAAEATLQQLKNGGNLRLISSQSIIDSIQAYDAGIRSAANTRQSEEGMIETFRLSVQDIFDGYYLNRQITDDYYISMQQERPPIRKDEAAMHRYRYWVHVLKVNNTALVRIYKRLLQRAVNLDSMVMKEYHFENETTQ